MSRKILIINGSPRVNGSTEMLADAIMKGIHDAGNIAVKINIRELNINPCQGCFNCRGKDTPCVQEDDMREVYAAFYDADVFIFASPLYWLQFTGPFKTMLDRLLTATVNDEPKKDAVLLMTAGTPGEEIFKQAVVLYESILRFMHWKDRGRILAGGVHAVGDVQKTDFLQKAYELGKTL